MPLYYFHIRKGDLLEKDPEGDEFATPDLAYEEALNAAREIMADKISSGDLADGHVFEITTETGDIVRTVPFKSVVRTG